MRRNVEKFRKPNIDNREVIGREPPDLNEGITRRIRLQPDLIEAAAREGGILEHASALGEYLERLKLTYYYTRVYEEARKMPALYPNPEPFKPGDEYYIEIPEDPDETIWVLPPARGQPGHDALRVINDALEVFWMALREDEIEIAAQRAIKNGQVDRKVKALKSNKMLTWAPVFAKEHIEIRGKLREQMAPQNATAKLLVSVAQLFDPAFTGSNCYSVVERIKIERKSEEGKAKPRERRRRRLGFTARKNGQRRLRKREDFVTPSRRDMRSSWIAAGPASIPHRVRTCAG